MRLDIYLTENKYTDSRSRAKELILGGGICVDGKIIKKPSCEIDEHITHNIEIVGNICPYVSRGGLKLEGALDIFGIDVSGFTAVDIGSSTGGFTDCLLIHGAKRVYAVDSGSEQLHKKLRNDERVVVMENFNARELNADSIPEKCDIAVTDVSFISQTYIIPNASSVLSGNGIYIGLVKPQFEAGRENIGKNGIVKDKKAHEYSIKKVAECATLFGFDCIDVAVSPIEGGDGNREFLIYCRKNISGVPKSIDFDKIKSII